MSQALAHEVIVVGAGPAGSATAYHLASNGIRTLLIDKAAFPRDKVCGDCLSPRAQHYLERLGLLGAVAAEAHRATRIRFQAPGGAEAETSITGAGAMPNSTLVLARRRFDLLLQQQALAAGARFRVGHVRRLAPGGGVELEGERLSARLVVMATGAALSLIKRTPLAPGRAVHTVAARCYLTRMSSPGPDLRFFFDHLPLPGYAWLFPTGSHSANLGYWYSGRAGVSAAGLLPKLLKEHPLLSALTAGGEGASPVAGYPIRSDFLRAPIRAHGLLAVGEAAGLVNPFTGEGIDYALESAELAAASIIAALRQAPGERPLSARALAGYSRSLWQRFGPLFVLMAFGQRYAFNPWVFDRLFGRGEDGQPFVDTLIQVCFGAAPPARVLSPLELIRLVTSRPASRASAYNRH
ncbi:MAG: geranylgeranyl reductase family protein [Lamprobacter sp.]|uniref:geranylgeranyl reductase family protein n=1 Tax=Lamprobacter sp. TaxID=3100796 RepID=UPI002B258998|nr:geranylgeranyl reductase family protein [Lamprobacter sp.]MEA3641407.1 geranylgeranyl reductase family protein [Lamprobacter sp.]